MATPTEVVAGRLLATTAVTAVAGTRVCPLVPAEDPLGPYVVLAQTGGGGGMRLAAPTRLNRFGVRVDCYAPTEGQAQALLAAAVAALAGWSDPANGVKAVLPTEDADEDAAADAAGNVYKVAGQTFAVWLF